VAYLDELASEICLMAGRDDAVSKAVAEDALAGVLDMINDMAAGDVVKMRTTVSVTANQVTPIALPERCQRVIELGQYDSVNQVISVLYEEIDEAVFHEVTSDTAVTPIATTQRYWYFVDDAVNKDRQIRIYPAPTATTTILVRYFEPLDVSNADRLSNRFVLKNGAISQLAAWFPQTAQMNYKQFLDGVEAIRRSHGSIKRTAVRKQTRQITQHNTLARYLVG
jgi:hypothetical protein